MNRNPFRNRLLQIARERRMYGGALVNPYGSNYGGGSYMGGAMMGGYFRRGRRGWYERKSKKYGYEQNPNHKFNGYSRDNTKPPKYRRMAPNAYSNFVRDNWKDMAAAMGIQSLMGLSREDRYDAFAKVSRGLAAEWKNSGYKKCPRAHGRNPNKRMKMEGLGYY